MRTRQNRFKSKHQLQVKPILSQVQSPHKQSLYFQHRFSVSKDLNTLPSAVNIITLTHVHSASFCQRLHFFSSLLLSCVHSSFVDLRLLASARFTDPLSSSSSIHADKMRYYLSGLWLLADNDKGSRCGCQAIHTVLFQELRDQ